MKPQRKALMKKPFEKSHNLDKLYIYIGIYIFFYERNHRLCREGAYTSVIIGEATCLERLHLVDGLKK